MTTWRDGIAARRVPRVLMLACVVFCLACDREKAPEASEHAASHARSTQGSSGSLACGDWTRGPLSAPGAFDLALTSDGALLVWSTADATDVTMLHAQRLSTDGELVGASWNIPLTAPGAGGSVVEVSAAAAAGQLGLAWVVRRDQTLTAWATRGSERAAVLMPVQRLGVVEASEGARGRVLVAAGEDGEIQVTWRGARAACEAQTGTCSHYSRRSLSRGDPDERAAFAREMSAPCDPLLIGSLWADGSWYEAVCHLNPAPVAYVFSLRPAISYAEATENFAGCEHYGLSRAKVGAALWAQCPDGVAVATRSHQPESNQVLRGVTREMQCAAGRPILRAVRDAITIELPLSAPTDQIGAALPDVPLDARALWTGARVLVARATQAQLTVIAAACNNDTLTWTSPLTDGCGRGMRHP